MKETVSIQHVKRKRQYLPHSCSGLKRYSCEPSMQIIKSRVT